MSPEEHYRRLRDPERWVGIAAPGVPAGTPSSTLVRRRGGVIAAQVLVVVVVIAVAAAVISVTAARRGSAPADPPTPIGSVVRSVPYSDPYRQGIRSAASDAALYFAVAVRSTTPDTLLLTRVDAASGAVTTRRMVFPDLAGPAVGPSGLYLSTSILPSHWDRSRGAPHDTVARLDLATLATLASRSLVTGSVYDSRVSLATDGAVLVEADGGGSVRLLDPHTLVTQQTAHLLTGVEVRAGDAVVQPVLDDPTSDGARVWVLAEQHFVALDLATLHTLVSVPQQGYASIVPTAAGLRVLGTRLGRLAEDGAITPDRAQGPIDAAHPVGTAASTDAGVLEEVSGESGRSVFLQVGDSPPIDGLDLTSSGALLGGSGRYGWLAGVPGEGSRISEVLVGASNDRATPSPGPVVAMRVTAPFTLHGRIHLAPVPAGAFPAASAAEALASCGAGSVCGSGRPQQFLIALVTSQSVAKRLAYVLEWSDIGPCVETGPPTARGSSPAPSPVEHCALIAVVDATTGGPLFSESSSTRS